MREQRYSPDNVPSAQQLMFNLLQTEFPDFIFWERWENYDRWLSAGIINPKTGGAVTVPLIRGSEQRTVPFTQAEINRIREHLTSQDAEDLVLLGVSSEGS